MTTTYVLIPAGGSGVRFGHRTKKQFLTLGGETLLNRCLNTFIEIPDVKQIIVSLPQEDLDHKSLIKNDRIRYVAGGRTRSESVYRGFSALKRGANDEDSPRDDDIILIHDAARPLVSRELIRVVAAATREFGAAVPGRLLADTIKQVTGEGFVAQTIHREKLRAVQTPQGFLYGHLKKVYRNAKQSNPKYTDEAMLLEEAAIPVKMVDGEPRNIKITTASDLSLAERILTL